MTDPAQQTERSDRELLAAHLEGDSEAFGVLFARHRDRLWAVALRTCGHPEDAADALQEALISAFRRAGSFRGDAQVTTWLHRVVVNACLDRIRANKVRAAEALPDDLEEWAGRGSLGTTDPEPRPDEAAEAAERRTAVLAALGTLPEEQRAALVLVDMEGYSVAEVAEILDCAPGTVKSRCARGRARLAALLLEHRPGERRHAPPRNQAPAPSVPSMDPARAPPVEPAP
ncbi:RNA polymerase sigma factor SigM [Nocardioides daejeonensis]|uniref:RNA polymerase sigma factor SigM n=1 Tax=Nocardioides daejeonensis TaxID=1046556 RepID=UPI000D740A94|nr:RNA polymerase sigma factor SigM [Nocardioides daejeonensis]